MSSLIPLSDLDLADLPRVGAKAMNLGRLARAGLPVPRGFVLPAEVFTELTRGCRTPEEVLALSLPPTLEAELTRTGRRLGPRLAVRSSAVDEDGESTSFAGQHETFLGVAPADLPDALRRCWASLYGERALAYREHRGVDGPGAMAVVVQRMVEARASGVLFTINPLTGSWREMTVEATWGLGEGLVSGQITPHWYLVRRPRRAPRQVQRVLSRVQLHLLQEDLPEIRERWVPSPEGGVRREPVPASLRGRPTLRPSALMRLCRRGLAVESLLGGPQDVEWVLDERGALYLLQARPITAAGAPRGRSDVLWTRRFIGERWPEPATVLGWSLVGPLLEWFIAYPRTQRRYLGGGPAVRLVHSRPYMNITVFRHLAFKLPGAPPPRFMMEFLPPEEEEAWQRRFAVRPDVSVYASILRETLAERRWRRFRWNPLTNPRAWDDFEAERTPALEASMRPARGPRDAVDLCRTHQELMREYCKVHVTSLLFANLFYQLLEAALAAAVPERSASLMERLATCPPGNRTLAANEALWSLARQVTPAELDALERGEALDPDSASGQALAEVLAEYGHRSDASWEIFSPRWAEEPARLVPLLRMHRSVAEPPALRAARQVQAHDEALSELRALLSDSPSLPLLERLIRLTRRYLLLRENQRFWFDRLLFATKTNLLWLGEHLTDQGWLEQAADISSLTWEEVVGLVEGTLDPEPVPGWVRRRQAQRRQDLALQPPVFLRGDEAVDLPEIEGSRLQGLGISPGRARGRVRVLRSPQEGHRLEPGDVLVTRAVDPGWTPLFLTAGAVVLEMGSRLSHGAVVAREYGLPAVVNLDGITHRLRDGQEVTVDGTRGIVWVHP